MTDPVATATPGGGGPAPQHPARTPWYRRRGMLVTGVVLIVLLITVLTDLPVHSSRAQDVSDERSVMSEVNTDVAPCGLAAREALALWQQAAAGSLSAADRSSAPGLLRDDQAACSFTNQTIFDLSNIEVPSSAGGRDIGSMIGTTTLWATSDALAAIEDVQTLVSTPGDARARADLAKRERLLEVDRHEARASIAHADLALGAHIPQVALPSLPTSPPTG